jgi:hypothetical protein
MNNQLYGVTHCHIDAFEDEIHLDKFDASAIQIYQNKPQSSLLPKTASVEKRHKQK